MGRVQNLWWRFRDRIDQAFEIGDFKPKEDPYWYVSEIIWEHVIINVKTKGTNYFCSKVDDWMNIAIKESLLCPTDVGEEFAIDDIIDGHRMKCVIKMLESGFNLPALEFICDELDTNVRDLLIEILLS
jgi:hypothetical protein